MTHLTMESTGAAQQRGGSVRDGERAAASSPDFALFLPFGDTKTRLGAANGRIIAVVDLARFYRAPCAIRRVPANAGKRLKKNLFRPVKRKLRRQKIRRRPDIRDRCLMDGMRSLRPPRRIRRHRIRRPGGRHDRHAAGRPGSRAVHDRRGRTDRYPRAVRTADASSLKGGFTITCNDGDGLMLVDLTIPRSDLRRVHEGWLSSGTLEATGYMTLEERIYLDCASWNIAWLVAGRPPIVVAQQRSQVNSDSSELAANPRRVRGATKPPARTVTVEPIYPAIARQTGIRGLVTSW